MGGKAQVRTKFSVLPDNLSEELSVPLLQATSFCCHVEYFRAASMQLHFSVSNCFVLS